MQTVPDQGKNFEMMEMVRVISLGQEALEMAYGRIKQIFDVNCTAVDVAIFIFCRAVASLRLLHFDVYEKDMRDA